MGLEFYRTGEKVEVIIRDGSGGKIETHKCHVSDRKKFASILAYLKDKYGFEPEVSEPPKAKPDSKELNWWE